MLSAACALLWSQAAWAGAGPAADGAEVRLGFGGIVKIGVPAPLDVVLPPLGRTGPAELAADAAALGPEVGRVVTSTVVPFHAVAGAAQIVHAAVTINDPRRPLLIRVSVAGQEVLRRAVPISPERVAGRLLVALADDDVGLAALHRLPGRVEAVSIPAGALPRTWQEYSAVDLLVIRDLDPAALDAAQQDALRTWVYLGGRLAVIVRPSSRVPSRLEPLLPATAGDARTLRGLPALTAAYGGLLPPGPLTVTALVPRSGARRVTQGALTIMASWVAGKGRVIVLGIDPLRPPLLAWSGRLRLWDEALGKEAVPVVDPAVVAELLPVGTPLDPLAHAEVGGGIVLYIALLLGLLRWRPTLAGAAGSLVLVALAVGAFALLAGAMRARSATLVQVTILEPVAAAQAARATTVGVVAVPYGGRYRVLAARGMIAQPITPSSSLRIELARDRTELTGILRLGEPARPFEAIGLVPVPISASLSADGRHLMADLGSLRARHVELRRHNRIYRVGDLASGRSVTEIRPDGWSSVTEGGRTVSELSQHVRDAIFQGPAAGAILSGTTPVLVGEIEQVAPVFTLGGAATPGQRLTILLVPLERT